MSDTLNYPVITINWVYGAGGRAIARKLSEKTDLKWYDKDLIKLVAEDSGYSVEDITREGEEISTLDRILESFITTNYNSSHIAIYQAQKDEILSLAKEPCIILGRCSNMILKEADIPCLNIYLYADLQHRIAHAIEEKEAPTADVATYVETREKLRRTYYRTFTKHHAGDARDYDLMLNTSLLGYDKCLEIILDVLNSANK